MQRQFIAGAINFDSNTEKQFARCLSAILLPLPHAMLSISRLLIASAATHLVRRNRGATVACGHPRSFNTAGAERYNVEVDNRRYNYSYATKMFTVTDILVAHLKTK